MRAPLSLLLTAFTTSAASAQVSTVDLRIPRRAPEALTFRIALAGMVRRIPLTRTDLRARDFRLFVGAGTGVHEVAPAPAATYRGMVAGDPGSIAAASLEPDGWHLLIRLSGGRAFSVQPASSSGGPAPAGRHRVFAAPAGGLSGRCGLVTRASGGASTAGPSGLGIRLAEIAVDADADFFQRQGRSVTKTYARILGLLNAVDALYTRDLGITLRVSALFIRKVPLYKQSDPFKLLPELRDHWNRNHSGIRRDVVHLFTGKGTSGGVYGMAYLASVCHLWTAYSLGKAFRKSDLENAALTAHELAHTFGALHCDGATPCNLMCTTLGGCSKNLFSFAPSSQIQILRFLARSSCLSPSRPPSLAAAHPARVRAVFGGWVELEGSRLRQTLEIAIGAMRVPRTALSFKSDRRLRFQMPRAPALGTFPLVALSPAGPSNRLQITITDANPPVLQVPSVGLVGVPLSYAFAGPAKGFYVLLAASNSKTLRFAGFDVLAAGLPLALGTLDAVGFGSFLVKPPPSLRGKRIWSQVLGWRNGRFAGASNRPSTFFF